MTTTTYSAPPKRDKHGALPKGCVLPERERLAAQQTATSFLVESCERALFDLRCTLGRADSPQDVRVGLEAASLLEDVLATWRVTLRQLRSLDEAASETAMSDDGS
jgi:hypothetical protein